MSANAKPQRAVYYEPSPNNISTRPKFIKPKYIQRITLKNNNNILIQRIIKSIPFYKFFFYTFVEYSSIRVGQMSTTYLESTKPIQTSNTNSLVLLKYEKYNIIPLLELIKSNKSNKYMADMYIYLLNSIKLLNSSFILHLNESLENILINEDDEIPLLKITPESIYLKDTQENIVAIILSLTSITEYCPIEIFLIQYLINNNLGSLSFSTIYEIIQIYKNTYLLDISELIPLLKKYINQPTTQIIKELLVFSNTWDNYLLSQVFLKWIDAQLTHTDFLVAFKKVLELSIDINPNSRQNPIQAMSNIMNAYIIY